MFLAVNGTKEIHPACFLKLSSAADRKAQRYWEIDNISCTWFSINCNKIHKELDAWKLKAGAVSYVSHIYCWQGQHLPLIPSGHPSGARIPAVLESEDDWVLRESTTCALSWYKRFFKQSTKRKQLAPGIGFYHFFKNWIRPCVELWMPKHLLHDRTAEKSVFKGQSRFYFPPALQFFSPLFIPVRLCFFFFFFFFTSFESAACQ